MIQSLLLTKHQAHKALLSCPGSSTLKATYAEARAETQHALRSVEDSWWVQKAQEIQNLADINNTQGFYDAIKALYCHRKWTVAPVQSDDGSTLFKDRHLHLDNPPQYSETCQAIRSLKNNKSVGPDGIPAEVFKHSRFLLTCHLHLLISHTREHESLPQDWKDANIVVIYKNKGDRVVCGNSRGISLLSVAGKVLAKIMLSRLVEHTSEAALPETQWLPEDPIHH